MARNQRNRARNVLNEQAQQARTQYDRVEDVEDDDASERVAQLGDEKIGTKKRAKLEAKAEKKAQREVEIQLREEKKKRDAIADEGILYSDILKAVSSDNIILLYNSRAEKMGGRGRSRREKARRSREIGTGTKRETRI